MKSKIQKQKRNESQSEYEESKVLSFSYQQPNQFQRKIVNANFNLSASASFNRVAKNSLQLKKNLKSITKNGDIKNNVKSREKNMLTVNIKSNFGKQLKLQQHENKSSSLNGYDNSNNQSGEWIKPRVSVRLEQNGEHSSSSKIKQKQIKISSFIQQQPQRDNSQINTKSHKQPKNHIQKSQTQKFLFQPSNKINKTQRPSYQPKKSQTKYSKFKDLMKTRQIQTAKSISTKKNQKSAVKLLNSRTKDSIQYQSYSKEQLLPSHFSYKSPNNYIKKYQSMTATPLKFMKSLNNLMQGSKGYQEHQYFKYQKMQKKLMYYNANYIKQNSYRAEQLFESENSTEKQKRVSYDSFIKTIKNKKKETYRQNKHIQRNTIQVQSHQNLLHFDTNKFSLTSFQKQSEINDNDKDQRCQSEKYYGRKTHPFGVTTIDSEFNQRENKQSQKILPIFQVQNIRVNGQNETNKMIMGLKFRKKDFKIERLQQKLSLIRQIEREFSKQNSRIHKQFLTKRTERIQKSRSKSKLYVKQ